MTKYFQSKGLLESLSLLLPVSLFYAVWILAEFCILINIEFDKSPAMIALLLLLGYLTWTLCEYIGHRYIEHRPLDGKKVPAWVIDWSPHVEHHHQPEIPDDVFDIHQSGLIVTGAGLLFMLLSHNIATTCILHTGFILGYLGYEWIHIGGHCPIMGKRRLLKFLFKNHHRHHTVNGNGFYGTSGPLWDVVFRTYR
ncbi:MAG: sterol desaturase family protein [Myxococcota bacterium]|jgi:hypothetical protein|nr:sterol desaturase family protein [Myxococcota bacterium]